MKWHFLKIFLIYSVLNGHNNAGTHFNQIKISSPHFTKVLLNEQKVLYKESRWGNFFSNALFYRDRLINHQILIKDQQHFLDLIALELLAYAKHCQWNQVNSIFNDMKNINPSLKQKLKSIKEKVLLVQLIGQQKNFKASIADTILWPMPLITLKNISHPKDFILEVKNICEI